MAGGVGLPPQEPGGLVVSPRGGVGGADRGPGTGVGRRRAAIGAQRGTIAIGRVVAVGDGIGGVAPLVGELAARVVGEAGVFAQGVLRPRRAARAVVADRADDVAGGIGHRVHQRRAGIIRRGRGVAARIGGLGGAPEGIVELRGGQAVEAGGGGDEAVDHDGSLGVREAGGGDGGRHGFRGTVDGGHRGDRVALDVGDLRLALHAAAEAGQPLTGARGGDGRAAARRGISDRGGLHPPRAAVGLEDRVGVGDAVGRGEHERTVIIHVEAGTGHRAERVVLIEDGAP